MPKRDLPLRASGEPILMVMSVPEAAIIAGRLKSMGIPAFIHTQGALPAAGLALGSKVLVPEKYYEAAMLVLQPDDSTPWLEDGEGDGDEDIIN